MGEALRPGGAYIGADGQLHDADGEPLDGVIVVKEDGREYVSAENVPESLRTEAEVSEDDFRAAKREEGVEATPTAREMLEDAGIAVEDVAPGSGKNGRVTKPDAKEAIEAAESEDEGGEPSGGGESPDEGEGEDEGGALDFASDEAAEEFIEGAGEDLSPAALVDTEPSGDGGAYTVDDVKQAASEA